MRELGYKPNNLARSLQGKSAKLTGLIFPNISNVFYAELIDKLEHQLFKNGYKTITSAQCLHNLGFSPSRWREQIINTQIPIEIPETTSGIKLVIAVFRRFDGAHFDLKRP